jgi:hypothetical protein
MILSKSSEDKAKESDRSVLCVLPVKIKVKGSDRTFLRGGNHLIFQMNIMSH